MVWIGRTVMPGVVMSISRNEMPSCFFAAGSVRTRQKIQSAYCASVVQVFCPLTTYLSPLRSARVRSEARSEPEPGSEKPWHQQMSRLAVFGRKCCFCASLPNCAITGPTMRDVERQRRRHVRLLHLVLVDVELHRRPVLPAPFQRPVRHRPAARVQDALRRDQFVLRACCRPSATLPRIACGILGRGKSAAPRRGRRVPLA